MMRSLFSAISGLKGHQTMMDVVGNNIANVNTTAYKASRLTFQDIISQTVRGASAPTATIGGQNPIQIGLGMQLGSIDNLMTQGNMQATNLPTDLAIQGDGFFVLSDNAATPSFTFTRDGNFSLGLPTVVGNPRPLTHNATGLHLKGYTPATAAPAADTATPPTGTTAGDIAIPATGTSGAAVTGFNIDQSGIVNLTLADGTTQTGYARVAIAKFPNAQGLTRVGNNLFRPSANSNLATDTVYAAAGANGRGTLNAGFLEMSNVDLASEFTNMIIAERGFQANSRVITASDEILQDLVNMKR